MNFDIDRSRIQLQTVSNLVTAGVLKYDEAKFYNTLLSAMTEKDILGALLESHEMRENCPNPIDYYPIGEIYNN